MDVVDVMMQRDEQYKRDLQKIGSAIGYGRAQQMLGELWDAMLHAEYGVEPGRGAMGVTVDDDLPPLPKPQTRRRQQARHGGYCMVPAYSESEMKAYGRAAKAWPPACGCRLGECESKPQGCRMAEEVRTRDPRAM